MIGRIVTFIVLLVIFCAIQSYSWLFLTGSLDVESISEKIGAGCAFVSFLFPIIAAFTVIRELILGGLL